MSHKKCKQLPAYSEKDQSQWVMLLPNSCTEEHTSKDNTHKPALCRLRHPRTNESSVYLFKSDNTQIFEALRFREEHRSWFIEDSIQADGSLHIPTPVDPLFLVLPYLIKASGSGKFMQIEQILEDESFPETNRLCSCQGLDQLGHVCQVKGADDCKVYRYDKDKSLSWLREKVNRLQKVVIEKKMQTSMHGSSSVSYVKSSKSSNTSQDEALCYAFGMLSDYLSMELSKDLQQYLGIKESVPHEKPDVEEPKAKRMKTSANQSGCVEDYTKQNGDKKSENGSKKNTRMTLAQKQLNKVDKVGMKNISSFFSPKSKK